MKNQIKPITPADIAAALPSVPAFAEQRDIDRANAAPHGSKTRANRQDAAARNALAKALMARHGIKTYGSLTKAIRAGHAGEDTDFQEINQFATTWLFNVKAHTYIEALHRLAGTQQD